jgi:hypothetical protein
MWISRGHALLWSTALHTLGFGVAGWTSYGRYREPALPELHVTRVYALHFLTPPPPKPRGEPRVTTGISRSTPTPPRTPPRVAGSAAPASIRPVAVRGGGGSPRPAGPSPGVQELLPGSTVTALGMAGPPPEAEAPPPVSRGVDRAAALLAPTGSACPQLPSPPAGATGQLAVAVALVVEADGRVNPAGLRVVESPSHPASERRFYPRIYVVGGRVGRAAYRIDPAAYDSAITRAVTRHMTGLTFRPALKEGRPVRSTVLIACHQGELVSP